VLSEHFAYLRRLKGEFASGDKEEGLDLWSLDVDLLEGGDNKSSRFSRPILCTGKDVAFGESDGDRFFLDRRGFFETGFEDAHEQFSSEEHVLKLHSLCVGYVFCLRPFILGWWTETGFPVIVVVSMNGSFFLLLKYVHKTSTYGVDEDGRDCWAMMMMLGWRERVYWLSIGRFESRTELVGI